MKTQMTLTELAAELTRQQETKRDFIVPTQKLYMWAEKDQPLKVELALNGSTTMLDIRDKAHAHIATEAKIPKVFYDRLRTDHPDILADTVNRLWQREPAKRMARTLDNSMRAFLSDKYRPLDNFDLANAVLPELQSITAAGVTFPSLAITESRMYIKAIFPAMRGEVKKGDIVEAGLSITNSEIGDGAVEVMPFLNRLVCLNGMKVNVAGQRRSHVGKRIGSGDDVFELYSTETRAADDRAFWLRVRDTVRGVLTRDVFDRLLEMMRETTHQPISSKVDDVVEVVKENFGYNETTAGGILQHLVSGGDFTRWGLANAITRQSQDEDDYDFASQLERDGGKVIELPSSEWLRIADPAPAKRKAA